jgi:chromosome condensin MukBEF complex kleisin-like MukF subunit
VIVRLMGEGQYQVDDSLSGRLNELDDLVGAALEAGDQAAMSDALRRLADAVREAGTRLDDTDLSTSDAVVPPEDLTLDEARELVEGEGLIPDLPVAGS